MNGKKYYSRKNTTKKDTSKTKKKKSLMNVEDIVEEMDIFRRKIVDNRQLPLKDEYKVVVTFTSIEKQLRSSKPKKKKLDKDFGILYKIFTTVKLSNTREYNTKDCIENVNEIKKGVDNILSILCI